MHHKRFYPQSPLQKYGHFFNKFSGGSVDLRKDEESGIAYVKLNNLENRNAMTGSMMVQLAEIAEELNGWKTGKAFILHGLPTVFCAGGDMHTMRKIVSIPDAGDNMCELMQDTLTSLCTSHLLSVAVIDGRAAGGGAELTTCCDFRIGTENCIVGFMQGRMDITTGWGGATRLVHLFGRTKALELLAYAGSLNSAQLYQFGFLDHIINGSDDALNDSVRWLEGRIASEAEIIRGFKQVVLYASENNLKDSLALERRVFASVYGGPAHQRALVRCEERRMKPHY